MKIKLFTLLIILSFIFIVFTPIPVQAQAYSTSFTTSITYQNVGDSATNGIIILFYATPSTTTPISVTRPNLNSGESSSIFIGNLSEVNSGFQGSAVLQADQPIVATLVQIPQNSSTVFVRPLSNGFSTGGSTALIATVLKNYYGSNTKFSIQNIDSEQNNVNIKFYNTSATLVYQINQSIEAGAAYYADTNKIAELGANFNGSVVATAKRADNSDGNIVGSALELDITLTGAKAFESVSSGATELFMPSALCDMYGGQRTSYAIQNTSLTSSTSVTVTYEPGSYIVTKEIGPGSKASFSACDTVPTHYIGSATITSTTTPVIAVGKAFGAGLSTAFLGESTGAAKLALPYVRWASDALYYSGSKQRTNIAIQNVGDAEIPANSITITYTDPFGHSGTHTITSPLAVGAKSNSKASDAGLTAYGFNESGSGYGGGAIINCSAPNCELIAIGRVQTYVSATSSTAAEDYNGIPLQ